MVQVTMKPEVTLERIARMGEAQIMLKSEAELNLCLDVSSLRLAVTLVFFIEG